MALEKYLIKAVTASYVTDIISSVDNILTLYHKIRKTLQTRPDIALNLSKSLGTTLRQMNHKNQKGRSFKKMQGVKYNQQMPFFN